MSAGNSTYSPLPQSNSDSDGSSEEELHLSQENRVVNRSLKSQILKNKKTPHEIKNNVTSINYKPLDNDEDGVTLIKFQSNTDEVSILKPFTSLEIFSTSRKICFVFSLLLCIFTTVAFIWVLPCNVGSCPNTSKVKKYNFTWEETLSNLEICGRINLVADKERNYSLIFLTRSPIDYKKISFESGLHCLNGKDRSLKWKINLKKEPNDIDCRIIDVNGDGLTDCVVVGSNVLKVISSQTGNELWNIQESNEGRPKFYFRDFPLVIPDVDGDNINELLTSCSFDDEERHTNTFRNFIIIVSGKTGALISTLIELNLCFVVHNLKIETNFTLSFSCNNYEGKESIQKISLLEVFQTGIVKKTNWQNKEPLDQHVKGSNVAFLNGFKLKLENHGYCPMNCLVLVNIVDEREGFDRKIVYSFNSKNTFGMIPVAFENKNASGFILKFWKWHSKKKLDLLGYKSTVKNYSKRIRSKKRKLLTSKELENEILLETEGKFQRMRRTVEKSHKNTEEKRVLDTEDFSLHVITELLVKIDLNDSDIHITNLTTAEIIQICINPQICQPDSYQQRNSVLVTPVKNITKQELISFSSSYFYSRKGKKIKRWQLRSKIRLSDLEF